MKTPGWLPLRRRGEAAREPPQAPAAVSAEEDEELCSPTEAIFRVFITACVAARHAALGGLANALPPGGAGHEPEDGVARVPVTPYTMLVVASAVAKTEQDLKSFPISPSASRASSARSSPAPSPGVTPPHSPSPTPPLSRQPSLELELGSSDPSMAEEHTPAASGPGRYKGLVVATAAPPSAHLSPSASSCSLPQTPQVHTMRRAAQSLSLGTPTPASSAPPTHWGSVAPSVAGSSRPPSVIGGCCGASLMEGEGRAELASLASAIDEEEGEEEQQQQEQQPVQPAEPQQASPRSARRRAFAAGLPPLIPSSPRATRSPTRQTSATTTTTTTTSSSSSSRPGALGNSGGSSRSSLEWVAALLAAGAASSTSPACPPSAPVMPFAGAPASDAAATFLPPAAAALLAAAAAAVSEPSSPCSAAAAAPSVGDAAWDLPSPCSAAVEHSAAAPSTGDAAWELPSPCAAAAQPSSPCLAAAPPSVSDAAWNLPPPCPAALEASAASELPSPCSAAEPSLAAGRSAAAQSAAASPVSHPLERRSCQEAEEDAEQQVAASGQWQAVAAGGPQGWQRGLRLLQAVALAGLAFVLLRSGGSSSGGPCAAGRSIEGGWVRHQHRSRLASPKAPKQPVPAAELEPEAQQEAEAQQAQQELSSYAVLAQGSADASRRDHSAYFQAVEEERAARRAAFLAAGGSDM